MVDLLQPPRRGGRTDADQAPDLIAAYEYLDDLYRAIIAPVDLTNATGTLAASNLDTATTALLGGARTFLNDDRDYYVNELTGSDSSTGATSATPWQTKQKAADVLSSTLDFGGKTVAVHLADGIYTGGLRIKPWIGGGILQFQGNADSPASVLVSTTGANAIDASFGPLTGIFRLKDMKLKCTTTGVAIAARSPGRLQYTNIVFDTAPLVHVAAGSQALIEPYGDNEIVGSAAVAHWLTDGLGQIDVTSLDLPSAIGTYTVSGGLTFQAFASAFTQSAMVIPGITFAGAGAGTGTTGLTFVVSGSAAINTQGSGAFYLPGNAAGLSLGGGQYL